MEEAHQQACDKFGDESLQAQVVAEVFKKVKEGRLKYKSSNTGGK